MEEEQGLSQTGVFVVNNVTVIADSFEPDEIEIEHSEEV